MSARLLTTSSSSRRLAVHHLAIKPSGASSTSLQAIASRNAHAKAPIANASPSASSRLLTSRAPERVRVRAASTLSHHTSSSSHDSPPSHASTSTSSSSSSTALQITDPLLIYRAKVANGELEEDEEQLRAMVAVSHTQSLVQLHTSHGETDPPHLSFGNSSATSPGRCRTTLPRRTCSASSPPPPPSTPLRPPLRRAPRVLAQAPRTCRR